MERFFSSSREYQRYSLDSVFAASSSTITAKAKGQGGNSLGLDPSGGALVLCLLSASWSEASDDDMVVAAGRKLFDDIKQAAVIKGLFNNFEYLNYAASFQDPIAGFG